MRLRPWILPNEQADITHANRPPDPWWKHHDAPALLVLLPLLVLAVWPHVARWMAPPPKPAPIAKPMTVRAPIVTGKGIWVGKTSRDGVTCQQQENGVMLCWTP